MTQVAELAFPALTTKLFEDFEKRRGRQLGRHLSAELIEAIDYALVHSKAPVEYLEALLTEVAQMDYQAAVLILAAARYGHKNRVAPEYISAVFMLPFESGGHDEDSRIEDRVAALHSAGVPAAYAVALRHTGFTVSDVVACWRDGISSEYVTATR